MLAKTQRIPGRDIQSIVRGKTLAMAGNLIIKVAPRLGDGRAGVSVSAKLFPLAVTRNRLRRRLLTILRPRLVGGWDIFVIVK